MLLVTGQDSPDDREQSMLAGADKFFVKPMSFKVLDRTIAEYLEDQT